MRYTRLLIGTLVTVGLLAGLVVSPAYADPPFDPPGLASAIAAQEAHTNALLGVRGVVGTAVGLTADGDPAVLIFTETPGVAGLPRSLDGVPVVVQATGNFFALHHCKGKHAENPACAPAPPPDDDGIDPTSWFPRPVPIGVSTGHPDITAGTIGARVVDTKGNSDPSDDTFFALSNNHVYANENNATIGDNVLQPGPFDEGTDPADAIGTLSDFEPIIFNCTCRGRICFCDPTHDNMIDAAIALSSTGDLDNATPSNGYTTPKSKPVPAVLAQQVQKYGRTTSLTKGEVTGINATVVVGYDSGVARFVNQIIISSSSAFIKGGDSGSLLVTDPDRLTVGLLFAGNSTGKTTIANPIGPILTRFGVSIDGE